MHPCHVCTLSIDHAIRNATQPIGGNAARLRIMVDVLLTRGVIAWEQAGAMLDKIEIIEMEAARLENACSDIDAQGLRVWANGNT